MYATAKVSDSELSALGAGLTTLAVTGTNGKTSTTSMLASIVRAAGERDARITTLGMWVGDEQIAADTSLASFARTVRRAREVGVRTLALEVTSRALETGFAARWPPQIAVFTNLTHDHLDRHGTPERYLAAKAQLFVRLRAGGVAVLNASDPAAALLAEIVPGHARCLGFCAQPAAAAGTAVPVSLAAARVECSADGVGIELAASPLTAALGARLFTRAAGGFQADNALAAALAASAAGYDAAAIRRGLADFAGVPGRFEVCGREPLIVVDFAHTPDALTRVLESARSLIGAGGRVGCVFGCGGERDAAKRPKMGALADSLADAVWLTTDNPRGESPAEIAVQLRAGATGRAIWHDEPDRRAAIDAAVAWAEPPDVVVIAGRGAETQQELAGGRNVPFLDAEVARSAVQRRARTSALVSTT